MWPKVYRYPVSNGVRQVAMHLTRHRPSHMTIAGHRVLLSYEGQPATCYGCGEVGHLYQARSARQTTGMERLDPPRTTYASIVTNKAPPAGRQLVETNATVGQNEADCNTVYRTTAAIVSDRETDTSMTEMEPAMATSIRTTPDLADGPANGLNCTPQPDNGPEGKGPKAADLPQNNHSSRGKGNIQTQDVGSGASSIVPHLTDIASRSDNEDTLMEGNDTSITSLGKEGTQEDIRHSPQRNKKTKIEKTGEHHSERSRNMP
jgi:hypothetical protein